MAKKPEKMTLTGQNTEPEIDDSIIEEPEIEDTPPAPKKQPQRIKIEVSTEKLETAFNNGFKELGKLLKPEPEPTPEPKKDEPPKPEPRKYRIGDEFDPFVEV